MDDTFRQVWSNNLHVSKDQMYFTHTQIHKYMWINPLFKKEEQMWSDVVRTDNNSSGNSRCHSLSTSYALGNITSITFLCLHKITHLRSKWMWRSSQENSTGSDMKQWPGRPFCSSAARSRSIMCPKVWLTWKSESLKAIQGHLSPNLNEVSKERKKKKKERREERRKEGKIGRERGRQGSESVLKSRGWCHQLSRQCMNLNYCCCHHLQPLICNFKILWK